MGTLWRQWDAVTTSYRVWPLNHGKVGTIPEIVVEHPMEIADLAHSPDGRWMAIAHSSDDEILQGISRLVDTTGKIEPTVLRQHGQYCNAVCFSPDGKWFASVGVDGITAVWDFPALADSLIEGRPAPLPLYEFDTTEARIEYRRRLAFHPSGLLYAASGDGYVFEWNLDSANPAASERKHYFHSNKYSLADIALSPDGRLLAVARHGWDGEPREGSVQRFNMVLVYDVSDPVDPIPLHSLPADFHLDARLAFSPDSRWVAANGTGDHGASVWDLAAADVAASRVISPVGARRNLSGLAFSPDLRWLGFGTSDGHIHLWDWRTNRNPLTIATGSGKAEILWTTNTMLAAGGASGAVEMWETLPEKLQEMARQSAGRTLSTEEKLRFGLSDR